MRVPAELDGAKVLLYARVLGQGRPTGKTRHMDGAQQAGPAAYLAIGHYDNDASCYLFGCDETWRVVTDTYHPSLEEAKGQAEFEHEGISSAWVDVRTAGYEYEDTLRSTEPMPPTPKPLRIILFGATGMIGSGVLQACLVDPYVESVLLISRSPSGVTHPKVKELLHQDFYHYGLGTELAGNNACLFCLGVSSAGMSEADYTKVTYELTLAAAEAMLAVNPGMAFAYVSGQGTDSTEQGRMTWARVKGRLENKLLSMPFKPAIMFRPGGIKPMDGVKSKTALYRWMYALMGPFMPFLMEHFPGVMTSSERLGRAMLKGVRGETDLKVVESKDINLLGV